MTTEGRSAALNSEYTADDMTANESDKRCRNCQSMLIEVAEHGLCSECLKASEAARADSETRTMPEPSDRGPEDPAATVDSKPSSDRSDSEAGPKSKRFGEYDVLGEIARGGMGVVYHARHRTLRRDVALKLILGGDFASENDVRRFQMEAESAAALDHPGIVPIYEIGQEEGHHFFAMKRISGGSLSAKMDHYRSDVRAFVKLLSEVADAIDYAHRRGILHRDLKPANILLDGEDRPVVTDLGLAKNTARDRDLTGTGAIVGTPAYMPPEQASGSKGITTAADIYALGAILYDGISGQPPHSGDTAVAALMHAAKGDVVPPSQLNGNVDRTLELICLKCLKFDPQERYASADDLKRDLLRWLAGDSVSVKPKSFAAVCGEMIGNQLRSVIGAMLLGVLGGLALGVPLYSGLAHRWFGRSGARFHLSELSAQLPTVAIPHRWWLNPPEMAIGPAAMIGIPFCFFLGAMIRKLVRPSDMRQAIAVGLVAGLLMTIVQFGLYGIAANWQTFALVNAEQIDELARAGFADGSEQEQAFNDVLTRYPGLRDVPSGQRAKLVSKLTAIDIMLSSPPVTLGCLSACLIFSGVYCLLGTTLAHRLSHGSYTLANRSLRYVEVMTLASIAGLMACIFAFTVFGMVKNSSGSAGSNASLVVPLTILAAAILPGWMRARWNIRWGIYFAAAVTIFVFFSM